MVPRAMNSWEYGHRFFLFHFGGEKLARLASGRLYLNTVTHFKEKEMNDHYKTGCIISSVGFFFPRVLHSGLLCK